MEAFNIDKIIQLIELLIILVTVTAAGYQKVKRNEDQKVIEIITDSIEEVDNKEVSSSDLYKQYKRILDTAAIMEDEA